LRWFLVGGCIGVLAAIAILILKPTDPAIILLFWPTSIVGIADPTGPMNQAVFGLIMFGGNFLLYGAFGAIAGIAADRLRR
jgi:hypothetical protein